MNSDQSYHRVRSIIPYLGNITSLRKDKILPKQSLFTKVGKGGKFPNWAEKLGWSQYGLFMETIIQNILVYHSEPLEECLKRPQKYLPSNFQKLYNPKDYIEFGKTIREHLNVSKHGLPQFEPEWHAPHDPIVGHPDLVTKDCVYDIKTTGRFNAMRTSTIYQILSYYCLSQLRHNNKHPKVKFVGLILPAQNIIFKVELKNWDWKSFWNKLKDCINKKSQQKDLYSCTILEKTIWSTTFSKVGYVIPKKHWKNIPKINVPLQFYLGGCGSTRIVDLPKNIIDMFCNKSRPNLFIHSPHTLNLCKPFGKDSRSKEDDKLPLPWTCHKLAQILDTGRKSKTQGVVVHCGRHSNLSKEAGLEMMYESLCVIVETIPDDKNPVPLLLENPAGQGKELLRKPEDFAEFYLSLPSKIKQKLKVCIDTCHAFAAGIDPMHFVKVMEKNNIPVGLIHFTDTLVEFGSRKDRHAPIGKGIIGMRTLLDVLLWANANDVPCVLE